MTITLTRLDPHIPDPIESRRRAAGRAVRAAYATIVFGILAFFVVYFGRPILYLGGPGSVSSPRYLISLPYIVQINSITVLRGASVKAGEEIGRVRSPQHDEIVAPICARSRTSPAAERNCVSRPGLRANLSTRRAHICGLLRKPSNLSQTHQPRA